MVKVIDYNINLDEQGLIAAESCTSYWLHQKGIIYVNQIADEQKLCRSKYNTIQDEAICSARHLL